MNRRTLVALALAVSTAFSSAADLKMAVIDMKKAFEDFHKTQEAAETYKGNYNKAVPGRPAVSTFTIKVS